MVEDVADLWAMERGHAFKGRYHVLGGTLSALDQIGPETLRIPQLVDRVTSEEVTEVILALNATVDGQTTAHYIADQLDGRVRLTSLAQGVPIGGELDYLDDGTISAALSARKTCDRRHARSTRTDPTEYPAPNEQIMPRSPGSRSSEYCANAMIDPAEDVLA